MNGESKLSLKIRLECRNKHSKWRITSMLDLTVHANCSRDLVSTIICVLWCRKTSITDFFTFEVINFESNTNLVVLTAHSLQIQLDEDFNGHAFVLCLDIE